MKYTFTFTESGTRQRFWRAHGQIKFLYNKNNIYAEHLIAGTRQRLALLGKDTQQRESVCRMSFTWLSAKKQVFAECILLGTWQKGRHHHLVGSMSIFFAESRRVAECPTKNTRQRALCCENLFRGWHSANFLPSVFNSLPSAWGTRQIACFP